MEKPKAKKDDWIKMQSKSRPGRFYLFNRATGETQWLSPGKGSKGDATNTAEEENNGETPPRILTAKAIKTPAQDRLKRLQHEIKVDRLKKQTNKPARRPQSELKSKKFSDSRQQQENMSSEQPTTSSSTKTKEKMSTLPTKPSASPVKPSKKRSLSGNSASRDEVKSKLAKIPLVKDTNQGIITSLSAPTRAIDEDISKVSSISLCPSHTSETTSKTSDTGILGKLKEIYKLPFSFLRTEIEKKNAPKKMSPTKAPPAVLTPLSELRAEQTKIEKQNILNKSLEITASSIGSSPSSSTVLEALTELRSQQKKCESQRENRKSLETTGGSSKKPSSSSIVVEALNKLRNQQKKIEIKRENEKPLDTSPANSSLYRTPTNLNIPNYQRGSANSRLDRLRQSLILQQTSASTSPSATPHITVPTTPTLSNTSFNISTNSLYQTANNTIDDEIEAMDWQPTEKDDIVEISRCKSDTSVLPQNKAELKTTKAIRTKSAETMGDIYDVVGENLLRLSAEKKRDRERNAKKWLKDFYYFVVDTNVLLDYLSFLEDLSKLKLCDTNGSVLYIPYGVLQELDKLKMRSGCQEGVKTMAVRAIKYLNKKFENNTLNLQAQTAIEEREHIIDVNSADDSIINCCLQAKERVPNLVLLTEDVNLRNKAICNNILVTTKSDLMCKRYGKSNENNSL